MKTTMTFGAVSAIALLAAAPLFAQTDLTGSGELNDRIDDIEEAVADDFARSEDESRFGNPEFRPGFSGSASVSYTGQTGNNESQEFSVGARLRYAQGQVVQTLGLALDFTDEDGASTKEDLFAVYDLNYYFDDRFYAFALGRLKVDGLAAEAANPTETFKRDAFLGFGPGYRVVNTPDMTWRVQAGIGVSYLETGLDESVTETGGLVASRFFYRVNESMFLTNDTDILTSDSALRANNDFGVNFKMTDTLSTRVSYLTEYNDSRAIRTDNKLGVSLVIGF